MPADRTPEAIFVGKRVLTQAGLDARHQRATKAVKQMERRRRRHALWQRIVRVMKGTSRHG